MTTIQHISAHALHERLEDGEEAVILDVREPEEYRTLHAAGALLLPLGEISRENIAARLAAAGRPADTPLYFICHTGHRAAQACERTLEHFPEGTAVEGGTLAWAQAGLPVHAGDEP